MGRALKPASAGFDLEFAKLPMLRFLDCVKKDITLVAKLYRR
jgi:hypothetical protein